MASPSVSLVRSLDNRRVGLDTGPPAPQRDARRTIRAPPQAAAAQMAAAPLVRLLLPRPGATRRPIAADQPRFRMRPALWPARTLRRTARRSVRAAFG